LLSSSSRGLGLDGTSLSANLACQRAKLKGPSDVPGNFFGASREAPAGNKVAVDRRKVYDKSLDKPGKGEAGTLASAPADAKH